MTPQDEASTWYLAAGLPVGTVAQGDRPADDPAADEDDDQGGEPPPPEVQARIWAALARAVADAGLSPVPAEEDGND